MNNAVQLQFSFVSQQRLSHREPVPLRRPLCRLHSRPTSVAEETRTLIIGQARSAKSDRYNFFVFLRQLITWLFLPCALLVFFFYSFVSSRSRNTYGLATCKKLRNSLDYQKINLRSNCFKLGRILVFLRGIAKHSFSSLIKVPYEIFITLRAAVRFAGIQVFVKVIASICFRYDESSVLRRLCG